MQDWLTSVQFTISKSYDDSDHKPFRTETRKYAFQGTRSGGALMVLIDCTKVVFSIFWCSIDDGLNFFKASKLGCPCSLELAKTTDVRRSS